MFFKKKKYDVRNIDADDFTYIKLTGDNFVTVIEVYSGEVFVTRNIVISMSVEKKIDDLKFENEGHTFIIN